MLMQDDMLGAIAKKAHVTCQAFGSWVPVSISIAATTHETYADFSVFGTVYTFTTTKWSRKGLTPFLQKFHDHTDRNEADFGKVSTNADGQAFPCLELEQKWNCIIQVRA